MSAPAPEVAGEMIQLLGNELVSLRKEVAALKEENAGLLRRATTAERELDLYKGEAVANIKQEDGVQARTHTAVSLSSVCCFGVANAERRELREKTEELEATVAQLTHEKTTLEEKVSSQKGKLKTCKRELKALREESSTQQETMNEQLERYKTRGKEEKVALKALQKKCNTLEAESSQLKQAGSFDIHRWLNAATEHVPQPVVPKGVDHSFLMSRSQLLQHPKIKTICYANSSPLLLSPDDVLLPLESHRSRMACFVPFSIYSPSKGWHDPFPSRSQYTEGGRCEVMLCSSRKASEQSWKYIGSFICRKRGAISFPELNESKLQDSLLHWATGSKDLVPPILYNSTRSLYSSGACQVEYLALEFAGWNSQLCQFIQQRSAASSKAPPTGQKRPKNKGGPPPKKKKS